MKRSVIAAGWIIVTGAPALLAAVFLFGCCVLPFHQVAHKLMPVCHVATELLGGSGATSSPDSSPAQQKTKPVTPLVTEVSSAYQVPIDATAHRLVSGRGAHYRSFISLGALRCDSDVGLYALVETFLI